MATLYENFIDGTLTSGINSSDTSIVSSVFASLPVVSGGDRMWLVLDPDATAGAPEVIQVTGHTAASTTVTAVRAQQSTAARSHASGVRVANPVTKTDMDAIQTISAGQIPDDLIDSQHYAAGSIDNEHPGFAADGNQSSGSTSVDYIKLGGMVIISGVHDDSNNVTLPSGFRPSSTFRCPATGSAAGNGYVEVSTGGVVTTVNITNTVYFTGVFYV